MKNLRSTIELDGHTYYQDDIAVFYHTGRWAKGKVEHLNGILCDNKWDNLKFELYDEGVLEESKLVD